MAKLYEAGEGESGCPGEEKCETFQSSAEDSEVRCPGCPKRSAGATPADGEGGTGDGEPEPSSVDGDELVDSIERLVRERDSGFPFPDDVTQLEKELIMIWDDQVATFDRAYQRQTTMLLQALLQVKK